MQQEQHDEQHEPVESEPDGVGRRRFLRGSVATAAVVAAPGFLGGTAPLAGAAAQAPRLASFRHIASARVAPPPIIARAEWGADERMRKGTPSFAPTVRLVVHHTVTTNTDPNPAATMRGIQRQHVLTNGWSDIGYNFVIDAGGRTYEGRYARPYGTGEVHDGEDDQHRGVIGAHTADYNTGAMGVALLGNFEYGARPTAAAIDALVDLLAWKAHAHGIDPMAAVTVKKAGGRESRTVDTIAGHRDYKSTACPGKDFYAMLDEVRERVRRRLLPGLVGYRVLASDGALVGFGDVDPIGDLPSTGIRGAPVRGAIGTPTGEGAWVVGPDGGIFTFGDARFLGSMGATRLNEPMVGMAASPDGLGYWTVASDGGIFTFGSARFFGSTGALRLNRPIVGMAPTPSGLGYWLVATDGGIFAFGDARFHGSTGDLSLEAPIVAMAATPGAAGYWLLAQDGGIFAFGDAGFHGSLPRAGIRAVGGARAIRPSPTGEGYWVLDGAGTVTSFGDAPSFGGGVGAGRSALDLVPVIRR